MNNTKTNKNAKIDLYKDGYQTGELSQKHFIDFYKNGYLYFDNVHFEKEYVEIENEQGIINKEWSKTKICGTIEARVKNVGMKQSDKFEILLNEFRNMDNKFTNAIGEIKTEIKEIKSDIKIINDRLNNLENEVETIKQDIVEIKKDISDIKSCPTIKKELEMLKK